MQTAQPTAAAEESPAAAAAADPAVPQDEAPASLLTRDDTFFGVCQGLGEDFGISPNLLRLAFALALFFNPYAALAAYVAGGAVVLLSRWIAPAPAASSLPRPASAGAEPAREREVALQLAA